MEPRLVTLPAFDVVGMPYYGKNENDEIKDLWQEFMPREDEIANATDEFFGVAAGMEEDGRFRYLAGRKVSAAADPPQGMESWSVPVQTYAAFPCTLATIRETYDLAFRVWLPVSAYEHVLRPDFEYYGPEFDGQTGEGLYVYIPVKAKASVR